ncbi:MAG: galactokinase family protein [Rectinema sp.]
MIPEKIPLLAAMELPNHKAGRLTARCAALASKLPPASGGVPEELHYYSSPGRTELGGNHTDHNKGSVLAAAVDLDMVAVVRPRNDTQVTLTSEGYAPLSLDIADTAPRKEEQGSPASIIRGIAGWLLRKGATPPKGFDVAVESEVPAGSGLSSSAAFELLMAAMFDDLGNYGFSPVEWAAAGQFAENKYFGKPCGLMDQIACAVGGIVSIDFGRSEEPDIKTVNYDFSVHGMVLAIVDTGSNHEDLTEEYAAIPLEMKSVAALFGTKTLDRVTKDDLLERTSEIRARCGDRAFLRAWHFVHETRRPEQMRASLARNDMATYLSLVRESGRSSWMYLQNIHAGDPRRQSLAVALALSEAILGDGGAWRVHGGGFAGTIQAYIPEAKFDEYLERMEAVFGKGSVRRLNIRPYGVCRISMH